MKEALDQWIYVLSAYGIGIAGTVAVTLWSWIAMRRAEARRERVRGK